MTITIRIQDALVTLYDRAVLGHPVATLVVIILLVGALGAFAPRFKLDASAESLVMENDSALRYYRNIRARYGSDDYLIVTYTPEGELFSDAVLGSIASMRDELAAIDNVVSVTSLLDVPVLESRDMTLGELSSRAAELNCDGDNRAEECRHIANSPLYRDLLISPDGDTTALRVELAKDPGYQDLLDRRTTLRVRDKEEGLTAEGGQTLAELERQIDQRDPEALAAEQAAIARVRSVLDHYRDDATLHLGGLPMIVVDSIRFIRHDLLVFGGAVGMFIILILVIAFRRPRWVLLPVVTCGATVLAMVGFLGLVGWRVTVVSSNFVALLLILTLALVVHLVVRHRELHELSPQAGQATLVREMVHNKFVPCLYTALTTMVAFASLIVSGIRPVIDFGWMMVIGLAVAFVLSFTLFPAALLLLEAGEPVSRKNVSGAITSFVSRMIAAAPRVVLVIAAVLAAGGLAGALRLSAENRFIDYFKESTEIHQGMKLIDQELGGTTPLDVILDAPPAEVEETADNESSEVDPYLDYLERAGADAGITASSHWLNTARLPEIQAIHNYLDGLRATGKVLSLAIPLQIFDEFDPRVTTDDLFLSLFYRRLPEDVKETLFAPFFSEDDDQLRFTVRVYESDPELKRDRLLTEIRQHLVEELGYAEGQVHLTGMLVLYNNMLQSLFRSQIVTLGAVFLAIMLMFVVLFRSFAIALIGIVPNLLSATLVLGLMGWAGIPLDLMTITIAAITIGIGVDHSIHYIHRFREEFPKDRDTWATIHRCHATIGRAIYYTSIIIILGFSVLALSAFIPTIFFGLFTGLAMTMALLANMTVLPALIAVFKPEG